MKLNTGAPSDRRLLSRFGLRIQFWSVLCMAAPHFRRRSSHLVKVLKVWISPLLCQDDIKAEIK